MTDIFDEVEEDLRRQKAEAAFKKHWPKLAALAVTVIVSVGGWRLYEWRQAEASAAAGARFEQAMRTARETPADAEKAFAAIAAEAPGGYRILARFRAASELGRRDAPAGVQAFDALAGDAGIGTLLQDLAKLRAAILLVDTASLADLQRRLEPLAMVGQPFRHSARELLALAATKAGDKAVADRFIAAIQADGETPQGVRARVELIAAVLAGSAP
ncbi:MAG: tetratricopeptide repeat protein [Alphaproteobacteria bacterium]